MFQDPRDQLFMPTVRDDIAFGLINLKMPSEEIEEEIRTVLKYMDLEGYDDMPSSQLSALKKTYKDSYAFRDKLDIEGIDHPKRMFDVTEALIRRGYNDSDIEGILGGNFKRVLSGIWATQKT